MKTHSFYSRRVLLAAGVLLAVTAVSSRISADDVSAPAVVTSAEETESDSVAANNAANIGPILLLKSGTVVVNNGDKFVPTSFITYIGDRSGTLPALTISNPVDMNTDGQYTVEYQAVGMDGRKTVKDLQVIVQTSQEAAQVKQQLSAEEAISNARNATLLGTDRTYDNEEYSVSGGSSLMSIIESICSSAEGRQAGAGGLLQCVDVSNWYIVNYLHHAPIDGNGCDIVPNLMAAAGSDIVEVSGPAPGVVFSWDDGAYGHTGFINAVDSSSAVYVTEGWGSDGSYHEFRKMNWNNVASRYYNIRYATTRENAQALGLQIIG